MANTQTKRIREIFQEVNESMVYGNTLANALYTHLTNTYYFFKDCGGVDDIDNRLSDVIYGLVTLYGYDMEQVSNKAKYILHNLNAPYEVSTMIANDVIIQLRKFDISTDDIFLFGVHQGIYQGIMDMSNNLE